MNKKIIQHHKPFDFETFFKQQEDAYIGIDYQDYENLFAEATDVHSFIGESNADNRVEAAISNALYNIKEFLVKANAVLIQFLRSPQADRPLRMDEMSAINEIVSKFPTNCDVVWGLADDNTLGNSVKVMLLVAVKD